jgi:hypothetical protein
MAYYYKTGVIVPFVQKFYKQMIVVVAGLFIASMAAMTFSASAATTYITTPQVVFQSGTPVVEIVNQAGTGALSIETPTGSDKAQVFVVNGGALSDLSELKYRTYRTAGSGQQVASLNITVSPWAGTFVYEPVYDTSQAVVNDVWQEWDVFSDTARWWLTGFPDTFVSWTDVIDTFEDRVVTAIMVNQGSGNGGLQSYVDYVRVNGTTYDFEVTEPDTQKPTAPVAIGVTSPAVVPCGGSTDNFNATLSWNASTDNVGVTGYQYNVLTPNGQSWTTTVNSTSYSGSFNDGEGAYTYRVRAFDVAGNYSAWSISCAITYPAVEEPEPVVLSKKDDCKDGGWVLGATTDGKTFKNQGQCVSHFASNAKSTNARNR